MLAAGVADDVVLRSLDLIPVAIGIIVVGGTGVVRPELPVAGRTVLKKKQKNPTHQNTRSTNCEPRIVSRKMSR